MEVTVRQKEKGKGNPWLGHLWRNYVVLLSPIFLVCAIFILPSKPLFGFTPSDQAKWWKSITYSEQRRYLEGLKHGYFHFISEIYPFIEKRGEFKSFYEHMEAQSSFFRRMHDIDLDVMQKSISEFYKDPANTYIEPVDILNVAIDKLEGKPVEAKLQELRERPWRIKKWLEQERKSKGK